MQVLLPQYLKAHHLTSYEQFAQQRTAALARLEEDNRRIMIHFCKSGPYGRKILFEQMKNLFFSFENRMPFRPRQCRLPEAFLNDLNTLAKDLMRLAPYLCPDERATLIQKLNAINREIRKQNIWQTADQFNRQFTVAVQKWMTELSKEQDEAIIQEAANSIRESISSSKIALKSPKKTSFRIMLEALMEEGAKSDAELSVDVIEAIVNLIEKNTLEEIRFEKKMKHLKKKAAAIRLDNGLPKQAAVLLEPEISSISSTENLHTLLNDRLILATAANNPNLDSPHKKQLEDLKEKDLETYSPAVCAQHRRQILRWCRERMAMVEAANPDLFKTFLDEVENEFEDKTRSYIYLVECMLSYNPDVDSMAENKLEQIATLFRQGKTFSLPKKVPDELVKKVRMEFIFALNQASLLFSENKRKAMADEITLSK